MSRRAGRRRFVLRLADAGADGDGCVYLRLRAALKRLLRSYALRCEGVTEEEDDDGRGAEVPTAEPPQR